MMTNRSTLLFGSLLTAAFLATVAVPASATKRMIIGSEPASEPNRSVYIISGEKAWVTRRVADGFDVDSTEGPRNGIAELQANTIHTVGGFFNQGSPGIHGHIASTPGIAGIFYSLVPDIPKGGGQDAHVLQITPSLGCLLDISPPLTARADPINGICRESE